MRPLVNVFLFEDMISNASTSCEIFISIKKLLVIDPWTFLKEICEDKVPLR